VTFDNEILVMKYFHNGESDGEKGEERTIGKSIPSI